MNNNKHEQKQKQTKTEQIYEKPENDFRVGGIGAGVSPHLWLCARKPSD